MSRALEIGKSNGRPVYLPPASRATHMHVLGASGRGKSKFLEHLIRQDILAGNGLCLIDPHGYLYHDLIRWCETKGLADRRKIVLFDPTAEGWTFGFNPLKFGGSREEVSFCVDAMVRACAQVWGGEDTNKTPLLKRCLRAIFHALVESRLTLLEAIELSNEADTAEPLRRLIASKITDSIFREQWVGFNSLEQAVFREQFASTNNRLLEFLAAPLIRTIVGQIEHTLDFAACMDEGTVVLVNLACRGQISDDNARLLGSLLVSDLFLKARRRPPKSRPFYLYIDECSLFVNDDIGRILDEGRKFALHLILAHQHLSQLKEAGEKVYSSVMTNAQTKVVFGGLSPEDAPIVSELLFMGELDLEEPKRALDKPVVTGYARAWMRNESKSRSATRAESTSTGGSGTQGENISVAEDGTELLVGRSLGSGTSEMHGTSDSLTAGFTEGWSETMTPVLTILPTQVFSLQEQVYKATALVVNQPERTAIVKIPGRPSVQVRTPFVSEAVARDERVERFKEKAFARSSFALPRDEAQRLLDTRRRTLLQEAKRHTTPDDPDTFFE
jgi:hypothetical protein